MIDEHLGVSTMGPEALAAISSADMIFLSSHGRVQNGDYRFRLRNGEWAPAPSLGSPGPSVAVFDSCDLVAAGKTFSSSTWLAPGRPSPAIVLGFVGPATDGYKSSMRGTAFAENLALGLPFGEAWRDAVLATDATRRDIPIAVGFGVNQADARQTLASASLTNMPGPTTADACYWETS